MWVNTFLLVSVGPVVAHHVFSLYNLCLLLSQLPWEQPGFSAFLVVSVHWAFPVVPGIKILPANATDNKRCGFAPWVDKVPWRRAWPPTPVFLENPMDTGASGLQSLESQRVRHD